MGRRSPAGHVAWGGRLATTSRADFGCGGETSRWQRGAFRDVGLGAAKATPAHSGRSAALPQGAIDFFARC
jgi:hypothetical protein